MIHKDINRHRPPNPMAKSDETSWDIHPKDIEKVIAQDKYDDCFACRVTGTLALVGLGSWSYYSGMRNLRLQEQAILKSGSKYRMGSRRLAVVTISATLIGMGIWRAIH